MFDEETLRRAKELDEQWRQELAKLYGSETPCAPTTGSGIPLRPIYTPSDVAELDFGAIGIAGEYPYTRGLYPLQYQFQPWVNQQVMGYGLPEDTHERMMLLVREGMAGYFGRTAFNLVFDLASQAGFDADAPESRGRVGQSGVTVSTIEDLDILFKDLPLDKISASLIQPITSNVILAMYIALGERRGIPQDKLRGNTMNFLYASFHQDQFNFPPQPSMRLMVDLVKYCSRRMPQWNTTNLNGYNIREAGATAVQELAFTLATGVAITQACIADGLAPDDFLPRFGFQISMGNDFFEDIAKLRALRRMWATINRERFGAQDPRSLQARMHCHTAGSALTAQQPLNNVVRAALHTLGAILAGTNALQTSSFDEALSIPTEEAATLALRTQQIIRHESGVTNVVDPLGGSYYVEWLTSRLESEAYRLMQRIEEVGGFIRAWERGWFRAEIAREAFQWREQVDRKERIIVGVNEYVKEEDVQIPLFYVEPEVERVAAERVRRFKERRDGARVAAALAALRAAAQTDGEVMPVLIEAARAEATLGEMMGVFREVFGYGSIY